LIEGGEAFLEAMRAQGVNIVSGGGETADVGDLTPTCTIDTTAVASIPRHELIDNDWIEPGLVIVGLASDGQAAWENQPNSGIGSNGLTSARHDLLHQRYRERYPETCDPQTPKSLLYTGPYCLDDSLPGAADLMTVGEALLSPTRTYAPLLIPLLRARRPAIRGLVHCSGGGQTKCLRFGRGVHFIKDDLFSRPPIFAEIQKVSGTSEEEMHRVFNMGHRMEIYCEAKEAPAFLDAARDAKIGAKIIGRTEPSQREDKRNHLTLEAAGCTCTYAVAC
jgi:phosphoribosylformylglycinamidine cyclo-ligase